MIIDILGYVDTLRARKRAVVSTVFGTVRVEVWGPASS